MVQVLVLLMNVAFAQDSLSYLLTNGQHMNVDKRTGVNKPSSSIESIYEFTQPSQFLNVVRSKDSGGYYLRVDRGTSGVSDIVEVSRKSPKAYATRKVTLDAFQAVTAITDCDGSTSLGGLVSDLLCTTVSRDYCAQIANDKSIGDFDALQEQINQCAELSGKMKRLVDIHVKQMQSGALANKYKEDTGKLKTAFTDLLPAGFDNQVVSRDPRFVATNNPGPSYAAKIISLCQLQKKSEGPSWTAAPARSNSLQNRGNAHSPRSTN